jgi:hypothetical protein
MTETQWLGSLGDAARQKVRLMGRVARGDAKAGDRAVSVLVTELHLLIAQRPPTDEHADMVALATCGGLWEYPSKDYIEKLCRTLSRDPAIWRSIGEALRSGIGDNPLAD